jgi:hypothetical protein
MTIPLQPDESGSLEFELIRTARYQLRALSDGLLRLGVQLDINDIPADRWGPVVRTLQLLDGLSRRNLIAVCGEQGAGKTHLLTNLYPAAAGWLEGNIGRGEKSAVAVQERSDCTEPRGIVVRRRRWDPHGRKTDNQPGEGLTYEVTYAFDQREQWRAEAMGVSSDVLLVVLEVPPGFLGAGFLDIGRRGFALLPGFERVRDTEWQHLMRLVLATSPAALVVVDGAGLANATQAEILEHLRHAGGQAIEFVVAVSRCEELRSPDLLAHRIHRAMEVYGAPESDVIPVGRTRSDPANWPDLLRAALGRIRVTSAQSHQLEAALLHQVIRDDVQDVVNVARTALDSSALRNDTATEIDEYMSVFDRACAKLRTDLRAQVHQAFGDYYQAARDRLEQSLEGSGWKFNKQWALDHLHANPGETVARLGTVVEQAWDPAQAQRVQRTVIDRVADVMWRAYGPEFMASLTTSGQGQAALALLGGYSPAAALRDSPDDRSRLRITPALRVLPGAALQARALALRLAAPDGQIPAAPDDRKLNDIVRDVAGVQRQLLTALSVVVGDADPAEGPGVVPEGPSEMLANLTQIASDARQFGPVVRKLLPSKTAATVGAAAAAKSATAAIAGTEMSTAAAAVGATAAAAGETAGAGAAVAGATAGTALTVALAAAGVAAVGATVLYAGNRVVRERDRLSGAWLIDWRTATEASILTNAEELLRITRDIVERRLCSALGADEDLDRRFRLRQAIEDVRRDRALMLEVLGDDHLA